MNAPCKPPTTRPALRPDGRVRRRPRTLVEAARRAYERGYRRMDAYSPFPVEGLAEAIGFHRNRIR